MRIRLRALIAALCLGAAGHSKAQQAPAFPESPIHIVVGFSAGGGNDLIARVLADGLTASLHQPVLVDNKAGAGGILAAEFVAHAAPDGYTLLLAPSGTMSVNEAVYTNLRYRTLRDFEAIAPVSDIPLVLVVSASSPVKSVKELVAFTKANPSKSNYGAPSTSFQLANELFKQRSGAQLNYVPYKSSGETILALLSGEITAMVVDLPPAMAQISAGVLRPLAATAATRAPEFPDLPTLQELGFDNVDISLWNGLFAPKGVPPEIVGKLRAGVASVLATEQTANRYKALSITTPTTTPAGFPAMIAADIARWKDVAASAHVSLSQ